MTDRPDAGLADLLRRLEPGWTDPRIVAERAAEVLNAPVPAYRLAEDAVSAERADLALHARRMVAVRTILNAARRDAMALLATWRPGMPDVRPVVASHVALLDAALAEVEAAERGCGQPDGECMDPCHLGVLTP